MAQSRITMLALVSALAVPLGSVGLIKDVNAQSFSCANAQLPSEMAICNNENLLLKDEQVAALLASRLVSATATGTMQDVSKEHGSWLQNRNACSNDMSCLEKQYDARILSLTGRDL